MGRMTKPALTIRTLDRPQRLGIALAITVTGGAVLGFGYSAPIIAQHLERMTGSGGMLGWLIAFAAIVQLIITPYVPKLLLKFDAKHMLVLSLVLGAACFSLHRVFMFPLAWFVLHTAMSLAFSITFVVCETWINQLAPDAQRGKILGMYGAVLAGGFGIGSAVVVFTGIDGWFPFLFGAALFLIGLGPLLLLKGAKGVEPPSDAESDFFAAFRIMGAAPAIIACGIVFGAIEQVIFHFLPVYGTRLDFTESDARILVMIAAIGNAALQIPMGMLADRVHKGRLLLILMSVATFGPLALIAAGNNFVLLSVFTFIYIGLSTTVYTVGLILLAQRFKGGALPAANAAFIMAYGLGSFAIPPIAGTMMDIIRPQGLMLTLTATGLIGLSVAILRYRKDVQAAL